MSDVAANAQAGQMMTADGIPLKKSLKVSLRREKLRAFGLVQDAEKNAELAKELNTRLEAANDYKNELIGKLRKHDLSRLSQQKPALVEGKINNATKRLLAEFETITGAVPAVTDSATK